MLAQQNTNAQRRSHPPEVSALVVFKTKAKVGSCLGAIAALERAIGYKESQRINDEYDAIADAPVAFRARMEHKLLLEVVAPLAEKLPLADLDYARRRLGRIGSNAPRGKAASAARRLTRLYQKRKAGA